MTELATQAIEEASATQPADEHRQAVVERAANVLRPAGAFGRLDEVAAWLAGWQRSERPSVERPQVLVFGADHGVVANGVSAYPAEVTGAMVSAIEQKVATCTALADANGAGLRFVDVGVGQPTGDLSVEDALDTERFDQAWTAGASAVTAVSEGDLAADLLILGELGIGNTTAAAAVAAGTLGGTAAEWVGRGTGVDDDGLARKEAAVTAGLDRVGANPQPLDVLRRLGGAELVAMAGAATEARRRSIPILLDGFIATAALVPLAVHRHGMLDHCLAGHCSAEQGHRRLLEAIDKRPLLELDLRLGEASGALVALPIVRSAAAAVVKVATFAEVGLGPPD